MTKDDVKTFSTYLADNVQNLDPIKTFNTFTEIMEKPVSFSFRLKHSSYVLAQICRLLVDNKEQVIDTWTEAHALHFLQKYRTYIQKSLIQYPTGRNPVRQFYWLLKDNYDTSQLNIMYELFDTAAGEPEDFTDEEDEFNGGTVADLSWSNI